MTIIQSKRTIYRIGFAQLERRLNYLTRQKNFVTFNDLWSNKSI